MEPKVKYISMEITCHKLKYHEIMWWNLFKSGNRMLRIIPFQWEDNGQEQYIDIENTGLECKEWTESEAIMNQKLVNFHKKRRVCKICKRHKLNFWKLS